MMQGAFTLQIMSKSWNAVMSVYFSPYFPKFISMFSKSAKASGCQSSPLDLSFHIFLHVHSRSLDHHACTCLLNGLISWNDCLKAWFIIQSANLEKLGLVNQLNRNLM